jgi:hypothetical protein
MYRCGPRFLSVLVIALIAVLTGCLGKNSANPGNGAVQSVSLNPSTTLSLDVGGTQVFSAAGKNANGTATLAGSIEFLVKSGSPNFPSPLSIASNGNACAGSWDPTATLCSPGTPGIAIVTAVINGVSSPPTTVYVHQHIDNIQVTQAAAIKPQFECFSQGQTWQYQGIAYSNNVDITNTVGPMTWTFSNADVVALSTTVTSLQPNQVQATAKSPGITQISATVGGTTSTPYPFTTCLVRYIRLQIGGQGQAGNSVSVNTGSSVNVTATVVDSLNNIISSPPLTWSTTNPDVAAFTTTTSSADSNSASTRNNVGGATLFASCTPERWNSTQWSARLRRNLRGCYIDRNAANLCSVGRDDRLRQSAGMYQRAVFHYSRSESDWHYRKRAPHPKFNDVQPPVSVPSLHGKRSGFDVYRRNLKHGFSLRGLRSFDAVQRCLVREGAYHLE